MPPIKLFLFGLDRAGKTAISRTIKKEDPKGTRPTLSFDISKWILQDFEFTVWDAPGQTKFREAWSRGYQKAQVMIYVLDVADGARFEESKKEFDTVLKNPETARVPLIFCFHKMDTAEAKANYQKAREIFKLHLIIDRKVFDFETTINSSVSLDAVSDKLIALVQDQRWNA
jgi:small GTP-binding protein